MAGRIDRRLHDLNLTLPRPQQPKVARILPWSRSGRLLFVSGQLPQWEGELRYVGKLGVDFDVPQGQAAARLSALNVLAQARAALDEDLDRVARIVKVGAFVNCSGDFTAVAQVANGASDLFFDLFGDAGRHARTAVGCANMPLGVALEIEATMEVD
jgi:enamine deaminase RidA (YjgF/YER057c/UK114 family)